MCKDCGYTFKHVAEILRPSRKGTVKCRICKEFLKEQRIKKKIERKEKIKKKQEEEKKLKDKQKQLKEKQKQLSLIKECLECGIVFKANTASRKYCSKECLKKHNNRAKENKRRRYIKTNGESQNDISLIRLIKRDKNICHICGGKCDINDFNIVNGSFIVGNNYPSIDHVIPISKGGKHRWDNIKLAHHHCNTVKSNKTIYEDKNNQFKWSV